MKGTFNRELNPNAEDPEEEAIAEDGQEGEEEEPRQHQEKYYQGGQASS